MFETILSCKLADFTVNTAVKAVDIVPIAIGAPLKNPGGLFQFDPQDNILIKSVAVGLPYCFSMAADRCSLTLLYWDELLQVAAYIPNFGTDGKVWLFSENVEIDLTTFFKWPVSLAPLPFIYLMASMGLHINPPDTGNSLMSVSMVNAPAILNGDVLPVLAYLKIIHTLPIRTP